jgi:hypothetical protein
MPAHPPGRQAGWRGNKVKRFRHYWDEVDMLEGLGLLLEV